MGKKQPTPHQKAKLFEENQQQRKMDRGAPNTQEASLSISDTYSYLYKKQRKVIQTLIDQTLINPFRPQDLKKSRSLQNLLKTQLETIVDNHESQIDIPASWMSDPKQMLRVCTQIANLYQSSQEETSITLDRPRAASAPTVIGSGTTRTEVVNPPVRPASAPTIGSIWHCPTLIEPAPEGLGSNAKDAWNNTSESIQAIWGGSFFTTQTVNSTLGHEARTAFHSLAEE